MANIKRSSRFRSQVFQKARQGRGDDIDVLDVVVSIAMLISRQELSIKELLQVCQCRAPEKRSIWDTTQKWNAPSLLQCFGEVVFRLLILVWPDLVDNNTCNTDIVVLTQDTIQLQLIKGRTCSE